MEFLAQLASWSLLAFAVLLFLTQVAIRVFGYWLGVRHRTTHGTSGAEGVGLVVGGMIGLLGFVLALILSFGTTRFDERRQGTLAEANAISTAWLRASAVGDPRSLKIADSLEEYARVRRDYIQADRNSPTIAILNQRTSSIQAEIWEQLSAITRERTDPVVVSLMVAINETFDMSTTERFAHDSRFPTGLFWLLIGMAHISMGALGYQLGLSGQKTHIFATLLTAVWTAVIVVILDLSAPRLGTIRTSVDVYDWALQDFKNSAPTAQPPR
jgi:hypothetical protein